MGMDRKEYLKYLNDLGITGAAAEKAADRYEKSIAEAAANALKSSGSKGSAGSGSALGVLTAGFIDMQTGKFARISTETGTKIANAIKNSASLNPLTIIEGVLSASLNGAEALISDIAKLNTDLIEKVRGAGGYVGTVADQMMDSTREAMIAAQQVGVATDDTLSAVKDLMVNAERMVVYSDKTISSGMVASLAFTKSSTTILENAENFRNVGIGLDAAAKAITEIGLDSVKIGLSAKATSDTLIKQVGKLNEFGFQNGVKGLGKMVQEAQALKINMDKVFDVATKVFDPEGAIELSANLQVVGGAFGDLADPIKLMYDATNNVESLQTSIIGAARSLATYNAEQGRFEVSGANLRRAKAMADALGMSMGELTNMAVKGAAKFEAMSQLDMFPSLTDDQKEFVSNIATIKDGKIGFDVPKNMLKQMGLENVQDGFVQLQDLSDSQVKQLQELQKKAQDEKPIDIARNHFNETTKVLNVATAIYLRLMEDSRKSGVGRTATNLMEEASKFMQNTFNPGEDTTEATVLKAKSAIESGVAKVTPEAMKLFEEFTNNPELKKIFEGVSSETQKIMNKFSDLPIIDKTIDKAGEIYENVKDAVEDVIKKFTGSIDIKVDINSNNTELANIIVNEISKNPTARANFINSIMSSNKQFT